MTAFKWLIAACGIVIILGDLYDLVRALVVPRPHTGGPVAFISRAFDGPPTQPWDD